MKTTNLITWKIANKADMIAAANSDFYLCKSTKLHIESRWELDDGKALLIFSRQNYWAMRKRYYICVWEDNELQPVPNEFQHYADDMLADFLDDQADPNLTVETLSEHKKTRISYDRYSGMCKRAEAKFEGWRRIKTIQLDWASFLLACGMSMLGLAVAMGEQFALGSFYLGDQYINQGQASLLFCVWSIPLTLLNGYLNRNHRGIVDAVALGMVPMGIRVLTLLSNTTPLLTWIGWGALLTIAIAVFVLDVKNNHSVSFGLEHARNTTAKVMGCTLIVLYVLDCIFSKFGWILEHPAGLV